MLVKIPRSGPDWDFHKVFFHYFHIQNNPTIIMVYYRALNCAVTMDPRTILPNMLLSVVFKINLQFVSKIYMKILLFSWFFDPSVVILVKFLLNVIVSIDFTINVPFVSLNCMKILLCRKYMVCSEARHYSPWLGSIFRVQENRILPHNSSLEWYPSSRVGE